MNLRRVLPIALLTLVAVIVVLATWGKRPTQREEAASIQQKGPVVAQNQNAAARPAIQVASVRKAGSTARSRGVYRRPVATATRVAPVRKAGDTARSRGVYRGAVATAAVDSPRQGQMTIPGTGVALWPER